MAQDGAFAGGQDRCEITTFTTQATMTDGVDRAMQRMQSTRPHTAADFVPRHPGPPQLRSRDDPVLAGSQLGDRAIHSARFTLSRYTRPNVDLAAHDARFAPVV
jgi:hypothetical protein